MKRRLVLTSCLLAVLGSAVGVSAAAGPVETHAHSVCVVIANANNYGQGQYICVTP
ncbi:MAG TPA: hypothetical protein VFH54_03590 [Mycobacteriales bacterium]|nr:hypothetical protein [Mycobacteriales bacterium]